MTLLFLGLAWGADPALVSRVLPPSCPGEGWVTRSEVHALGARDTPQGGELRVWLPEPPSALAMTWLDARTPFHAHAVELLYASLLRPDPVTGAWTPSLASHWREDGATLRFCLDPAARFADGAPLRAEDVAATLVLVRGWRARAVSARVVEVTGLEGGWRAFDAVVSAPIFAAAEIRGATLDAFRARFAAQPPLGAGPYRLSAAVPGQSYAFTRVRPWWADNNPAFDGMYNLDRITYIVDRSPDAALLRLQRGELDYLPLAEARWWSTVSGWADAPVRARSFATDAPAGVYGIALNLRDPLLAELAVREALQRVLDRPKLLAAFAADAYEPLDTYFPGWTPPDPDADRYDPLAAVQILERAGFRVGADGIRVRDGQRLRVEVLFEARASERYLTTYAEDARRAGIEIHPVQVGQAALVAALEQRAYQGALVALAAERSPDVEAAWCGDPVDPHGDDITAFVDPEVAAACAAYRDEPDGTARARILADIDRRLRAQRPFVLWWTKRTQRVAYASAFAVPLPWGSGRFARATGAPNLTSTMWRATAPQEAPAEIRYWSAEGGE